MTIFLNFGVFGIFVSYLLTHTAIKTPNRFDVSIILSISLIPETEGSATINTMSTPDIEAITGLPIPGRPINNYNFTSFVRLS